MARKYPTARAFMETSDLEAPYEDAKLDVSITVSGLSVSRMTISFRITLRYVVRSGEILPFVEKRMTNSTHSIHARLLEQSQLRLRCWDKKQRPRSLGASL